jgi:hypothetical protein
MQEKITETSLGITFLTGMKGTRFAPWQTGDSAPISQSGNRVRVSGPLFFMNLKSIARGALLSIGLLVFSAVANAQLFWDTRRVELQPSATDPIAVAEFSFANVGEQTVNILEVKSSCDCTTIDLPKKAYGRRERGLITAIFTIGDRVGSQLKRITLRTDSPDEPLVELTLHALIPEMLKVEPPLVRWDQNEAPTPRTLELSTTTAQEIQVPSVETTDDRLSAKLTVLESGKKYRITVTPLETTHRLRALLRVKTDYPAQQPKVYEVPIEIGVVTVTPKADGEKPPTGKRLILNPPRPK